MNLKKSLDTDLFVCNRRVGEFPVQLLSKAWRNLLEWCRYAFIVFLISKTYPLIYCRNDNQEDIFIHQVQDCLHFNDLYLNETQKRQIRWLFMPCLNTKFQNLRVSTLSVAFLHRAFCSVDIRAWRAFKTAIHSFVYLKLRGIFVCNLHNYGNVGYPRIWCQGGRLFTTSRPHRSWTMMIHFGIVL